MAGDIVCGIYPCSGGHQGDGCRSISGDSSNIYSGDSINFQPSTIGLCCGSMAGPWLEKIGDSSHSSSYIGNCVVGSGNGIVIGDSGACGLGIA